tara:strand:- start:703 stop:1230 length:528 start_codon:yes stop_codon:yes gene_type:complete
VYTCKPIYNLYNFEADHISLNFNLITYFIFHMQMLYRLPKILFFPLVLIWSVIYGGIAGFIYKVFAVYENWLAINRLQMRLWKKFPNRSYRKYIESMWAHQVQGRPVELAEFRKIQLEKSHPDEPFPVLCLLTNTFFMVLITPFMALSGLYYGPTYVFKTLLMQHNRYFNHPVVK